MHQTSQNRPVWNTQSVALRACSPQTLLPIGLLIWSCPHITCVFYLVFYVSYWNKVSYMISLKPKQCGWCFVQLGKSISKTWYSERMIHFISPIMLHYIFWLFGPYRFLKAPKGPNLAALNKIQLGYSCWRNTDII